MYDGYKAIARVYDTLNADIDYAEWSRHIDSVFREYLDKKPDIVLDLACGTGRMTFALADLGYDMIGIDGSAEMLALAHRRQEDRIDKLLEGVADKDLEEALLRLPPAPLFLQQDMRSFELYGTVDAAVCCLDSINYLVDEQDLTRCLSCVRLYLVPGGLFVFDVNTPYKFSHVYGDNAYVLEDDGIYCGWQNQYDEQSGLCHFYLSVFEQSEDGSYLRSDEEQVERCYTDARLRAALNAVGFTVNAVYGGIRKETPSDNSERWTYVCTSTKKE